MTADAGGRRFGQLPVWLLVAAIALVYGWTILFDFVNYDDYDLIVANTGYLEDPASLLRSFTNHAFSSHRAEGVYYRPILMLTYILDYRLWGLNAGGFHFTNVLLHILAATALYFLIRRVARALPEIRGPAADRRTIWNSVTVAALLGGLVFALHPVQTEAVAWVAGRNDVLLGLFVILFLLFYVRSADAEGQGMSRTARRAFAASVLFYSLALLTKEPAIFFVILVPLYEITIGGKKIVTLFSGKTYRKMVALASVTAVYLVVRYIIFGAFVGSEELYGKIPLENRFLMAPGLFTSNLLFVLWPVTQNITHPLENIVWFEGALLFVAIVLTACLVLAAFSLVRRSPVLSWTLWWIIVGMIPLLNVFPLAVPLLEHRLYTVMAGTGMAVALAVLRTGGGASAGGGRGSSGRNRVFTAAAALCVLLAVLTLIRLPVWRDSGTLWRDAIRKEPASATAHFNLAGYYYEMRQYDSTLVHLEKYVALRPANMLGYSKLRETYWLAGRVKDAARVCRRMINLDPKSLARYLEAGMLYERVGPSDSVISIYEEGLRADSGFYQLHQRLGAWYAGMGNEGKAGWHYERAIKILERLGERIRLTDDQTALLGRLYAAVHRPDKADSLARLRGGGR